MPRKYGLTKKQLIDEFETEFLYALNRPGDSIDQKTADAWKRFNREPLGNEVQDMDDSVTSDVREVVMGMLPQFSRTLALADNLAAFSPVGPEDEALADQETRSLNHVFWKVVPHAWVKVNNWMHSGLVEMNAYAEAWWDEKKVVREEEWEGLTIPRYEEMAAQPGWEATERSELRKNELNEDVFDVTFKITEDHGKPNWEPFPRSEFRISSDANELDPGSGRMCGRERLMSRSDLISMGFQRAQVSRLSPFSFNDGSNTGDSETDYAQALTEEQKTAVERAKKNNDKSQELLLVRKGYIKIDYDGDGIAELREIWTAGGEILRWKNGEDANRIVSRHPFHVLCAEPHPNQHFGTSPGIEAVFDQDQTTMLLRGMMNNLTVTNEPKIQLPEMSATENTREQIRDPGIKIVETTDEAPLNVLAVPFTAGESFNMLRYLEEKRDRRTGVYAGQMLDPSDMKHVQKSVQEDARDQSTVQIEHVARTFCETGFKSLLLHLHELMIHHDMRPMRVRVTGGYLDINPQQWRVREDMTVQVGTGMGSRDQQLSFLERTLAAQIQALQTPELKNLLITPQNIYQTTRKIAKLSQLDPDMHWTDPQGQLAAPSSEEEQQLQMQAQALQQAQGELQKEAQRIEKDKMDVEKMRDDLQNQIQMFNEKLKSARDMRKMDEQIADLNARLRDRTVQDELERMEIDLKAAKNEDERAEIRSRTALNISNSLQAQANAKKIGVESEAMKDGYDQIANELGGEESEE